MAVTATKTSLSVVLYYPNIIGYLRVVCMTLSFYYALQKDAWQTTLVFYLLAFGGDVVDGYVARAFDQCSGFGGVLDMVTDRVSTCGFLAIVSHLYPAYTFAFVMLIVLDISSHWFHVISVTAHHKSKEALEHRNPILQWYYSIYPLFGYCCVGTEFFYILLYVLHHYPHKTIEQVCFYGCLPACVLKQVVNVIQLVSAADAIAAKDAAETANSDVSRPVTRSSSRKKA
jgi:CDP-diacylglycerol--inositol 3-phosphatidyltransferase